MQLVPREIQAKFFEHYLEVDESAYRFDNWLLTLPRVEKQHLGDMALIAPFFLSAARRHLFRDITIRNLEDCNTLLILLNNSHCTLRRACSLLRFDNLSAIQQMAQITEHFITARIFLLCSILAVALNIGTSFHTAMISHHITHVTLSAIVFSDSHSFGAFISSLASLVSVHIANVTIIGDPSFTEVLPAPPSLAFLELDDISENLFESTLTWLTHQETRLHMRSVGFTGWEVSDVYLHNIHRSFETWASTLEAVKIGSNDISKFSLK